jgi:hypothetical protein
MANHIELNACLSLFGPFLLILAVDIQLLLTESVAIWLFSGDQQRTGSVAHTDQFGK